MSDTLTLSPELIEYMEKEIPIKDYYDQVDVCTASHILFAEFIEKTKWHGLPKVIFYILLQNAFGMGSCKDERGNFGYNLTLKPQQL